MASNTPNRARKRRQSKACTHCRRRKIRCDFQYPTCGACLRAGETCVGYDSIHGVEKPRSTITHLEQEVARLETELQRLKSPNSSTTDITNAAVERVTTRLAASILNPEESTDKQEELLPLTSPFFLSGSPVPYLDSQAWDTSKASQSQDGPSTPITVSSLPRQVVDTMLKHYCEIYRPQYPAMEESELYQACDRVCNSTVPSDFDAFCVHITLAISTNTLRYRDPSRAEAVARGFWTTAVIHLKHVGLAASWERLEALQLLSHYGYTNPKDIDCVRTTEAATRLCLQLGLHQELPSSQQTKLDVATLIARRRLFWHSYSIDSAVHSTRCRAFMWPRSSTLKLVDSESHTSPTTHVWSLRQIETQITVALYYPTWSQQDALTVESSSELYTRLEENLKEWHRTARENIILREKLEFHELHYQMQVMRLNRPSPRWPDPTSDMQKKALNACISLLREFCVIDRLGKLFYLWHAAHCVVEAATCLLASVLTGMELDSDTTHLAREEVSIFTKYIKAAPILLYKIARRWTNITHHASTIEAISTEILERLKRWLGGDIVDRTDSHELRQKLNRMSLFSPFPTEMRLAAVEPPLTTETAQGLALDVPTTEDIPIDTDWGIFQPAIEHSSSIGTYGIDTEFALAWDFAGMDPEEIFGSLLDRAQGAPLLNNFLGSTQYAGPDSSQ